MKGVAVALCHRGRAGAADRRSRGIWSAVRTTVDLVLVAVVYAALTAGPVDGLFAGTIGGLAQDALSAEIIGLGGMAKTLIGFFVGVLGSQFNVDDASRACCHFRRDGRAHGLFLRHARDAARRSGWSAVLGPASGSGIPWSAVFWQGLTNGAVGRAWLTRRSSTLPGADAAAADAVPEMNVRRTMNPSTSTIGEAELRLGALQYIVAVIFLPSRSRFWIFQVAAAPEVPRDGGEQPSCGRCRCPRRAACCSIATARCWSRTGTFKIALVREQTKDLDGMLRAWRRRPASTSRTFRRAVNRRRREPSYRPIEIDRECQPRAGGRGSGRTCSNCLACTTRKSRRASIRAGEWPRTSSATSARSPSRSCGGQRLRGPAERRRSSVRRASSSPTTGS